MSGDDFYIIFDIAIDALSGYEYQLFATYFHPSLLRPGELLERTVGREEEAKRLWAKLGDQLMESVYS